MGAAMSSNLPPGTLLGCLLENLKSLKLMPDLKASKLIYLCNKVWIQYQLDNSSKWPLNGTLDPIILRDLNAYCQRTGNGKRSIHLSSFQSLHVLLLFPNPTSLSHETYTTSAR